MEIRTPLMLERNWLGVTTVQVTPAHHSWFLPSLLLTVPFPSPPATVGLAAHSEFVTSAFVSGVVFARYRIPIVLADAILDI